MVKLEEVPDEEFVREQPGPINDEDDWESDEDDVSDVSDTEYQGETLSDRVAALKDIIPPQYRKKIVNAASTGYNYAANGAAFTGSALWIVGTSVMLLGIPWALSFSEEQQIQEMDREMRMQQGANDLLTGGGEAKPAL